MTIKRTANGFAPLEKPGLNGENYPVRMQQGIAIAKDDNDRGGIGSPTDVRTADLYGNPLPQHSLEETFASGVQGARDMVQDATSAGEPEFRNFKKEYYPDPNPQKRVYEQEAESDGKGTIRRSGA